MSKTKSSDYCLQCKASRLGNAQPPLKDQTHGLSFSGAAYCGKMHLAKNSRAHASRAVASCSDSGEEGTRYPQASLAVAYSHF